MTRDQLSSLIKDPRLEELELKLKEPNLFYILKFQDAEIRHSNFLAWLLNPKGNHGLDELFLKRLLKDIFSYQNYDWIDEFIIDSIDFSNTEVRREWNNIDILIICEDFIVCIENKMHSKEHSDQLRRYREIIEEHYKGLNKAFVYLTPYGEEPENADDSEIYSILSYSDIASSIETILKLYSKMLNDKVLTYLEDYLIIIKRDIMKEDELIELVQKIYNSHKEAIDFILENIPNRLVEAFDIFKKRIEESGWIMGTSSGYYARFLTPKLNEIIPREGTGWTNHESFLFEIIFNNKMIFKTTISPGDKEIIEILKESLNKVEGAKKPRGSKWLSHFRKIYDFVVPDNTNEEIETYLNENWESISKIVTSVEKELLKNEKLKNYNKLKRIESS